jgi:hypothetical protein
MDLTPTSCRWRYGDLEFTFCGHPFSSSSDGALTLAFEHGGLRDRAHIGFFADGAVADVFLDSARPGSTLDALAADGAILISLLHQHGATPAEIGHALRRCPGRLVGEPHRRGCRASAPWSAGTAAHDRDHDSRPRCGGAPDSWIPDGSRDFGDATRSGFYARTRGSSGTTFFEIERIEQLPLIPVALDFFALLSDPVLAGPAPRCWVR